MNNIVVPCNLWTLNRLCRSRMAFALWHFFVNFSCSLSCSFTQCTLVSYIPYLSRMQCSWSVCTEMYIVFSVTMRLYGSGKRIQEMIEHKLKQKRICFSFPLSLSLFLVLPLRHEIRILKWSPELNNKNRQISIDCGVFWYGAEPPSAPTEKVFSVYFSSEIVKINYTRSFGCFTIGNKLNVCG